MCDRLCCYITQYTQLASPPDDNHGDEKGVTWQLGQLRSILGLGQCKSGVEIIWVERTELLGR